MKIQVRKPFFPEKSIVKIVQQIHFTLKSGQLTLGKKVELFENKFAKFQGMKYGIAVSSATAGLHLALLSLKIKEKDEVIVPAKTFISTANAAIYCNANPIFCDVDEETFQIDPLKLKKMITKKTKAIIPVHIAGNICRMDQILEIASAHNIPVIEDAAHAHGATLNQKKAGSFGKIGVFSFYPDKVMASSDGGIVVTNNSHIYDQIVLLRNVGRSKLGKYDFSIIGYNYRMNEIQAIIALEQLKLLPMMLKRRRELAKIYDDLLDSVKNIKKQKILPDVKPSYYAYVLRLIKGNLSFLRNNLLKKGIETSPMFTTLYKTKPYLKLIKTVKKKCPVSEKLDIQTFTIPLHPGLPDKQVEYVCKKIKQLV